MENKKPGFLISLLISFVITAIIVAVIVGLTVIKLPTWPFILFLFGITALSSLTKTGWIETIVGGLIGILVGSSDIIVAYFLNETVGTVVLLVLVIILIALSISDKSRFINKNCLLVLTVITAFHAVSSEIVLPVIISYLITAALFGAVILITSLKSKSKVSQ